jgi:hypothetical protein
LGFGFWNDPFSLAFGQAGAARKLPVPPRAVWFFYGSQPNDMVLSPPNPGWGWKAQTLTSPAVPGWLLAAPAAAAYVATKIPGLRQMIMGLALRALSCDEQSLESSMDEWHTYEIHWKLDRITLMVDRICQLESSISPPGPLGFVAWIDNQYAVASPQGGLRFGIIPTEAEQSLMLQDLVIEPSSP